MQLMDGLTGLQLFLSTNPIFSMYYEHIYSCFQPLSVDFTYKILFSQKVESQKELFGCDTVHLKLLLCRWCLQKEERAKKRYPKPPIRARRLQLKININIRRLKKIHPILGRSSSVHASVTFVFTKYARRAKLRH